MIRNQTPRRILSRLALLALLAAPGTAAAQLDDPGLAPSAPTPAPAAPAPTTTKPAEPPAKAPDRAAPAATATQRQDVTATPAQSRAVSPDAVLVGTDTQEEEKVEKTGAADLTPDEWESRLVAPSLSGPVGLFRMVSAEVGQPLNLRVGSHLQFFKASSFLISGSGSLAGDENSRFLGDLTISLTGPDLVFLRNLEAFVAIYNSSNQNVRSDPGRTDPSVILALADVGWGLKGAWNVAKGLSLGGILGVRFFNSVSGVSADFDASAVNIDLLGMYDVRKIAPKVPLRFHLNFGYQYDNSLALLPTDTMGRMQCFASVGNDACIRSRVVQTFAYGLNTSRMRFSLGAELPLRPKVKWGYFGVAPFIEYHVEGAVGSGDEIVGGALSRQADADERACTSAECRDRVAGFRDRISNKTSQFMTLGVRLRPVARLVIDAGIDFALQSPGFQYGPPLATWNVILGAAYTYGPESSTKKTVTRTVTKTYEIPKNVAPPEGKVAGVVRDSKGKNPIAGATVRYAIKGLTAQSTGDDGAFKSYALPPGPTTIFVTHPDYESQEQPVSIEENGVAKLDFSLKGKPPREGRVKVRVVDNKENPVMNATVRIAGPNATRDAALEGEIYAVPMPAGTFTLTIDSPQFLAKEKPVTVTAGQDTNVDVSLTKRPTQSHVELTREAIVIKGTIQFATNEARILPAGQKLLDEVADVLAKNPQVRRVSVEGHTDNAGAADKNMRLSLDRAAACVEYLVRSGISSDRLASTGFGRERPLVPNTSGANKAKNRRVEFRIVDQASGGASGFPQ